MAIPEEVIKAIGIEGIGNAASVLSRPADEFGNCDSLESAWAVKASEHADIYFNLICSVDAQRLKLTPHDDVIYSRFRAEFPDLPVERLQENLIKSDDAKQKWRPFCNAFSTQVEDFSFATLLRLHADDEYSANNTVVVPRVQFYAIELARNREGHNQSVRDKFPPTPRHSKDAR